MRIVLITQWFDPEPHFKGLPFARALQREGHHVTVLTGFPNYPGGKLYPPYRIKPWQREIMEGIDVVRVPLYPSHDRSRIGRVLNYTSFALSAATFGVFLVGRVDAAYVYHPPATVGLAAMVFRWVWGTPFIYDVQDLWPDTLSATGMIRSPRLLALIGGWCRLIYGEAAHVTVLSPGFRARLVDRGVPAAKIDVIYNWCDEKSLTNDSAVLGAEESGILRGRFNLLFAGNMGPAQGLSSVLEAARLMQSKDPEVQFVFVGEGVDRARLQEQAKDLHNVVFLPRRRPAEMAPLFAAADALLVHLSDAPLFAITIPSKIQAYLAVGRPLVVAVRGDAANLVAASGAGVACDPEHPAQLAAAVAGLKAMSPEARLAMGKAGQSFYAEKLRIDIGAARFASLLKTVARRTPDPAVHLI